MASRGWPYSTRICESRSLSCGPSRRSTSRPERHCQTIALLTTYDAGLDLILDQRGADMADLPGGASGLLVYGGKGKEPIGW
jgi:hypothetical protein